MKSPVHWLRRAFVALELLFILIGVVLIPSYSSIAADGGSETYVFVLKWGAVSLAGQFKYPSSVAVDDDGNVYVADTDNHRIQKFGPDGIFLTQWGSLGSGDGQFYRPHGVAVDDDGDVYVADRDNNRIQKFDSDGNYLAKWGSEGSGNGEFGWPQGVAVDNDGNVYVADGGNDRIQKFDSEGNYLAKWGSEGDGDGEFWSPRGVEVDGSGNVYVADTLNHRVQKFDSVGDFLAKWGSKGSGDGEFSEPESVAVDNGGNVYVADTWNWRIQKFDSNGNFIAKWGDVGELGYLSGVAVDDGGNIYVADTYNHRIQKFRRVEVTPTPTSAPTVASTPTPIATPTPEEKPEVTGSDWLDGIPLPTEISTEPKVVGTNLGLALFFALAFGLTSTLFNATLEENEELIRTYLASLLMPFRRAAEPLPRPAEGPRILIARPILLLLLSALLYAFLDPGFGISASGAIILLSLFVALAVLVYSYEGAQALLGARFYKLRARFQLFPIALAFGVACVLLTRWMDFHPGYLYGFVAGFAFLDMEAETPRRWALLVVAGAGALLAASLAAWGLAVPVSRLAEDGLPGASVLYGVLVAIFVAGLEGLLFTLVPLTFMDGSKVMAWSRAVWGGAFGLAAWLFFHVLINPGSAYLEALTSKKVLLMLGTLAGYSFITVGTWLFFRWYAGRRAAPGVPVEVEESVPPPVGETAIEPAVAAPTAPPRPEPVVPVRPEAPEERVYPWYPMTWLWRLIYALLATGFFILWPLMALPILGLCQEALGPGPAATVSVVLTIMRFAVPAGVLLEAIRPEKVREVVLAPTRGVIFRRKSGEEKPMINKVTRLRQRPPSSWEIKGLSPEEKKIRARVFRRGAQGGLVASQFDEFAEELRRLVAPDVEIEPPPLVLQISFWVMTSFTGLCILFFLFSAWLKESIIAVISLPAAIIFATLSLFFLRRPKRAVAIWSVVIGLAIVAGTVMTWPALRAELPKLALPQVEWPFAKAPPTETPVPTPITFRDDVFSFEYPSNWKRMSESEVNAARAMLSLGGAAGDFEYVGGVYTGDLITGQDLGLVAVTVIKVSGLPGTLTDAQFSQLKATYERQIGSDLLSVEKTQVGSMSGVALEVLQSGMRNLLLLIFSGEQGRAYMFFCATSEGKFDDHLAVFERARSTLRISAPIPITPTLPAPTATAPATPSPTVPTATPSPSPTVPVATPSPTVLATPPSEVITYTVQAGDTLSEIAAEFGVTVDAIAEANDIEDPSLIRIGQVLVIPSPGPRE